MCDWAPERLMAAVREQGTTLLALDREYGLKPRTCWTATVYPHANGEAAIADFLGVPAHDIWPSRYRDGVRLRPQPPENYHRMPRFRNRESRQAGQRRVA